MSVLAVKLVDLKVYVFFKGGHFGATYQVEEDPGTWQASVKRCEDDARARTSQWPFLWLSTYRGDGRRVGVKVPEAGSACPTFEQELRGGDRASDGDGHGGEYVGLHDR